MCVLLWCLFEVTFGWRCMHSRRQCPGGDVTQFVWCNVRASLHGSVRDPWLGCPLLACVSACADLYVSSLSTCPPCDHVQRAAVHLRR